MSNLEQAARQALEALQLCANGEDDTMLTREALSALREALEQPKQEPFEYWNVVEGWAKIDEVREHFDSVGCGTIYKTAGEGRVPLAIAQPKEPKREWVGLTEEEIQQGLKKSWVTEQAFESAVWWAEQKLKEKNT